MNFSVFGLMKFFLGNLLVFLKKIKENEYHDQLGIEEKDNALVYKNNIFKSFRYTYNIIITKV